MYYTTPALNQRCARPFLRLWPTMTMCGHNQKFKSHFHTFLFLCVTILFCALCCLWPHANIFSLSVTTCFFVCDHFTLFFLRVWPPSGKHGHRHTFLCVTITCTITRTPFCVARDVLVWFEGKRFVRVFSVFDRKMISWWIWMMMRMKLGSVWWFLWMMIQRMMFPNLKSFKTAQFPR